MSDRNAKPSPEKPGQDPPFTLLVNSCDAFEDCWMPFFTLLARYWTAEYPPILLNTETKDWSFGDLPIITSRVQQARDARMSWSQCLDAALARVQTPLVLYMQEDYFIEQPVDHATLERTAAMMLADPSIRHIGLTHFGAGQPLRPDTRPGLSRIGRFASYRISTQAALWRTETLRSYLLEWESGWMFEIFGTVRSWKRNELFLTLDRAATRPAITYQHTGIVKGQWSRFVEPLFEREGIAMNFNRRGFYDATQGSLRRRLNLLRGVVGDPIAAAKSVIAH